jgi:hypothetical protein
MRTVKIRTDHDPRSELAEVELAWFECGEVLLGERPVYDDDGHVSEMVELVYGDPSTSDEELSRLGLSRVGDVEAVELVVEPF